MKMFLILSLLVGLSLMSCKKVQPELNQNNAGCDCAKEVSADFFIEEMTTFDPNFVKYTDTDTIFANKGVRFRANENEAEYTWYIGAEVLSTQEVIRYFSSALQGQTITVSLVIKKKPNSICFPNDDGLDSLSRSFYIVPEFTEEDFYFNPQPRFEGVFRMKDKNSADSIDIIAQALPSYGPNQKVYLISNYNGLGGEIQMDFSGTNYNQLQMLGSNYTGKSKFFRKYNKNYYELFLIPEELAELPPFNIRKYQYFGRKLN